MGKRGSLLIHFLMEALISSKYINLQFENTADKVFSLTLPRKTKKLNVNYEQILKDWRALKKQPYKYSKAKAAVETALKKSDFVELISSSDSNIICRILNEEEITEKKRLRHAMMLIKKEYNDPPSVESSGYGSGEDGSSYCEDEDSGKVMDVEHDHASSSYGKGAVSTCENEDSGKVIAVEHDHMSYSVSPLCSTEWQNDQIFKHSPVGNSFSLDSTDEAMTFTQNKYSFVNPNDVFHDHFCPQNSEFCGQMYGAKAMEVDSEDPKEQNGDWSFGQNSAQPWPVVGLQNNQIQQNDDLNTEAPDSAVNVLEDLQDVFDDIPIDNLPSSPELDEVMKAIENLLPSSNSDSGSEHKIVCDFKEFKTKDIWIFKSANEEFSLFKENGDSNLSKIIQDEIMKRKLSFSVELDLSTLQISILVKKEHLGN